MIAAALAAILLGGAGFALGRLSQSQEPVPVAPAAPDRTAGSASAEPVANVATNLLPSVVQIETEAGVGSGVVYKKGGLILTAAHVVEGASEVLVRLSDGRRIAGRVVGSHEETDVAVVRASQRRLPVAALAIGEPLRVGQIAVAIGSPFGFAASVTSGVISALERPIDVDSDGTPAPMIQTDAPINPGNSGGALADRAARVIGINDLITTTTGANSGIGFAIPIDVAASVADALVKGQQPRVGFLGVVGTDPARGPRGALITDVQKQTPAADAGLKRGDVIVSVAGRPVGTMAELASAIRLIKPGALVTLEVLRRGDLTQIEVRVGAQ